MVASVLEVRARIPSELPDDQPLKARIAGDASLTGGHPGGLAGLVADYQQAEIDAYAASQDPNALAEGAPAHATAAAAAIRRETLRQIVNDLSELSLFDAVSKRFVRAKRGTAISAVVVAAGAGCFAYATSRSSTANPSSKNTVTIMPDGTVRVTPMPTSRQPQVGADHRSRSGRERRR